MSESLGLYAAIKALPFPVISWSEEVTEDGVKFFVSLRPNQGPILHTRLAIRHEQLDEAEGDPDAILGHYRAQLIEMCRHQHPEVLPKGSDPL